MAHCASDQNCETTPQSQITPHVSNKTRIRTLIMALTRNGLYVPDELLILIYEYLGIRSGEAVILDLKLLESCICNSKPLYLHNMNINDSYCQLSGVVCSFIYNQKHENIGIEFFKGWTPIKIDVDLASIYGLTNVLECLLKRGLPLKYTKNALDYASANGLANVLEWWYKIGLELKYTDQAMDLASANGHINVLEWWVRSGLPLKQWIVPVKQWIGHVLKW